MNELPLQLQWNLDRSTDHALNVGLEFVRIAANDNVQPVALMACERFGITLPICRRTRSLLEKELKTKADLIPIRYMKALVVPSGGQIRERLCSNIAGLNFLALATSLLSVMTIERSAATIQRMIEQSAGDKTLIPPEFHVLGILEVIEPSLNRMGFLEKCFDWEHWLIETSPTLDRQSTNQVPSLRSVECLVVALRNLARLGDEKVDRLVVTCASSFAWLITFIEWCLGSPPAIYLSNNTLAYPEPEPKVTIVLLTTPAQLSEMTIESFTVSGSLHETISVQYLSDDLDRPTLLHGMVNVQKRAEVVLRSFKADSDLGTRAVQEAISRTLSIPEITTNFEDTTSNEGSHQEAPQLSNIPRVFPEPRRIHETACKYLGSYAKKLPHLQPLIGGSTIFDLPILRQWAERTLVDCDLCRSERRAQADDPQEEKALGNNNQDDDPAQSPFDNHLKKHVGSLLAILTSDILMLSLFNISDLDTMRLAINGQEFRSGLMLMYGNISFYDEVHTILTIPDFRIMASLSKSTSIMEQVLRLIDHLDNGKAMNYKFWITSSKRGQVLLPRLLSDMTIDDESVLSFHCVPGVLAPKDRPQGSILRELVSTAEFTDKSTTELLTVPSSQVFLSRFSTLTPEWHCSIYRDSLQVKLTFKEQDGPFMGVHPCFSIDMCRYIRFVPHCPHKSEDSLPISVKEDRVQDYVFVHPNDFLFSPQRTEDDRRIFVYATRGSDAVRIVLFGTVAFPAPIKEVVYVLSRYACFKCSLRACREVGASFLIL